MNRSRAGAAAIASSLLLASTGVAGMRLHFIDTGAGAATLIELPCATVLLDGGAPSFGDPNGLTRTLERYYAAHPELRETIDWLVPLHPPGPEPREASELAVRFHVRHRVAGEGEVRGRTAHLSCGGIPAELSVLRTAGQADAIHPLVVRVTYGEGAALVAGDLDAASIAGLLRDYADRPERLDADVYQIGPRASGGLLHRSLLRAIQPRMAVVASQLRCSDAPTQPDPGSEELPSQALVRLLEAIVERVRPARRFVQVTSARGRVEPMPITRGIYATGWDGPMVIEIQKSGWTRLVSAEGTAGCGGARESGSSPTTARPKATRS